jgi:hypothetical protein
MADLESKKVVTKKDEEARITSTMEQELTDEQLVQLAEGASSWGANCNKSC